MAILDAVNSIAQLLRGSTEKVGVSPDDDVISERDQVVLRYINKIHKDNTRISVEDDNNVAVDKVCWKFFEGQQWLKPVLRGGRIEYVAFTDEEVKNYRSKVNKVTSMIKAFAAKMMDGDVEAAAVKYPENKDFMDEQMAGFINALSRVIWRSKRLPLIANAAAKDGGITGKGNIGVTTYDVKRYSKESVYDVNTGTYVEQSAEIHETDFDIEYVLATEVFRDNNAKQHKDSRYVYRRYTACKETVEAEYGVELGFGDDENESDIYKKGVGNIIVWDIYSKPIKGVDHPFHVIAVGNTAQKILWFEEFGEPVFPLFVAGFNIVGDNFARGRGYVRDIIGIQTAINAAHSVVQRKVDNYKVLTIADRNSKIQLVDDSNYTGFLVDGNPATAIREFQHSNIPGDILNQPNVLTSEMMNVTGIRETSYGELPSKGNRMAVGTMNVLVQSEKRNFTEDMMHFSMLIADVVRYAIRMVQLHYSKEKILDMVGVEHTPAIDRFKDGFDVYHNYDFYITVGTGFTDNVTMAPQDTVMGVNAQILTPKEAKAIWQRQGYLPATPYGAIQAEGKARALLEFILKAEQPDDLLKAGLTLWDDFDVIRSVFEDYVRSYRYIHMIESDPIGLQRGMAIDAFMKKLDEKQLGQMQHKMQLQMMAQQIQQSMAPAPMQQGQQTGNPNQMPEQQEEMQ